MLTFRRSIESREFNARQYIKQALKSKKPEKLEFTGPQGSQFQHVMTRHVLLFMVKALPAKNKVYSLILDKCNIDDAMIKILVNGNWSNLVELSLFNNNLTGACLEYFKQAKWKHLQILDIGRNPFICSNGKSFVIALPKSIIELQLAELGLTSTFIKDISDNKWTKIKFLNLSKNGLKNSGLIFLVQSKWPLLQSLDLTSNFITNDGCKALQRGFWRCLKRLDLTGNMLDSLGLSYLACNQFKQLQELSVRSKRFLTNEVNYSVQKHIYLSMSQALLRFGCASLTVEHLYPNYYEGDSNLMERMVMMRGRIKII